METLASSLVDAKELQRQLKALKDGIDDIKASNAAIASKDFKVEVKRSLW